MEKQVFRFNTFGQGLNRDATKYKTEGLYSAGLDIIGINEIGGMNTGARPDTVQLSQMVSADSVSASQITGLVNWISNFSNASTPQYYAFEALGTAASAGGRLYTKQSNQWISAKSTSAAQGGGGLEQFGTNLYYAQNTVLGQVSANGVFINNFQSFSIGSTQNPHPLKAFSGKLCCGDGNLIATYDGVTWTANKLTLPAGMVVKSLAADVNYLWISADDGNVAKIFIWNGSSATFQEQYPIPETTAPILVSKEGQVYAIGKQIYLLSETYYTVIFPAAFYNYTAPTLPSLGATALWKNHILFGVGSSGVSALNADNVGGVWLMGRYGSDPILNRYGGDPRYATEYPLSLSLAFFAPTQTADQTMIGGMYSDGNTFSVGYQDTTNAIYGIGTLNTLNKNNSAKHAYYVTHPIDLDSAAKKIFHSIKIAAHGWDGISSTLPTIDIYYRLDVDLTNSSNFPAWTLLDTLGGGSSDRQFNQTLPLRQFGRNIQFKFVFHGDNSNRTAQMTEYALTYEILDANRV